MILTSYLGWSTLKGIGTNSNPRLYERKPGEQPSIKVKRTVKNARQMHR